MSEMVERVARAMMTDMFAEHELPSRLADADLFGKYCRTAHAAIAEVQRWRSIAEAPKDEKPILAYWGPIQEGAARCMDTAVWHEGSWVDPDDIGVRYGPPTHWQPLPAPPKPIDYDDGDHGRPDAH